MLNGGAVGHTSQTDYYYRRRYKELDQYGAAMFLDPVKTPEEELIERDEIEHILDELLGLPARAELVIRMYYGFGCEPNTLQGVAEKLGITKERVRQILAKGERRLTARLLRKLRPERYRRESAERIRQLRADQAREAEWEAERKAEDARRQAEFRAVEVPVRVERNQQWRYEELREARRPYDPWASLQRGFHLEHYEPSQVENMKQRLRSMRPSQLARLRDYVIENNLNLMMEMFGSELNGGDDA